MREDLRAALAELRTFSAHRAQQSSAGSQPISTPASARAGCWRRHAPGPRSILTGAMYTFLSVIQIFIAVILVFLVLMHSGRDTGLSGAFGVGSGAGPLGGGSLVERNLNRWTGLVSGLLFGNTIALLKIG